MTNFEIPMNFAAKCHSEHQIWVASTLHNSFRCIFHAWQNSLLLCPISIHVCLETYARECLLQENLLNLLIGTRSINNVKGKIVMDIFRVSHEPIFLYSAFSPVTNSRSRYSVHHLFRPKDLKISYAQNWSSHKLLCSRSTALVVRLPR